jgi:pimeloyl-ACP methyl ester carboxylesterase
MFRFSYWWRQSHALASIAVLVSVLVPACNEKPPTPPMASVVANETDPQWVSENTPHAKVAVVFVHGIFGDTLGTWRNDRGETFFRLLKSQPEIGSQLDIFAFGFTSNMFKSGSFDIREAANKLHESLQYNGVLDYPTVVFVAHSMGGLVVLGHLLTHRELLEKVPLIMLYATPQEGAQIASIADHVAHNPALKQMVPADGNAYLQQLNDDWKSLPARPHVSCAYEKLPTYGVLIVPWTSATRFCDGAAVAVETDHIGIVKPDRLEHDSIVVLVNALRQYVVGKNLTAKLETPDFIPEGDRLTFQLSDPFGKSTARLVNAGGSKLTFTLAQISDPQLYLWPDDTPREIPAKQTQLMQLALGFAATSTEYRFVLQSDVSTDRQVVVKVANIADIHQKQAKLIESASANINTMLADPTRAQRLASLPPGDPRAVNEVVDVVRNAIVRENPKLPESAQWVLSASLLSASNWPQLAAVSLRRAENLSPGISKSSNTRWLAGVIAAQSGNTQVFASADTPKVSLENVPKVDVVGQIVKRGQGDTLHQTAIRLQTIPSLKYYGLSLEGDFWAAAGNKQAAHTAYKSAASLESSPSLSHRITELQSPNAARAAPAAPEAPSSRIEPN